MRAIKNNSPDLSSTAQIRASNANLEIPSYSKRETLLTMAGVLLVMLLAAIDQTIVATAMPHIIADLHGFDLYTWVTTAYLLTSTVMIPIYGKLSDLIGRKPIFLVGVVLFLIGSVLSGASQTMDQLIAFRAFQGLGAAALIPIAIAVIGDLFAPRERGKWQGLTGAVFGLASIIGPAAGGWITENSTWRWVFYVNLPIGIIALLVLIFLMPQLRNKAEKVSVDYIGAALLIAWTLPLLLGFTWAGSQYPWLSPQILGLFAFAIIALVCFIVYEAYLERRNAQPIINPSLFKNPIFSVSMLMTTIIGMGMYGSIFFLPLFAQSVLGISPTNSGLTLTPLMLSLVVGSVTSGQLVSRFGRYKWVAIVGMIITISGSLLLLRLNVHSTANDLWLSMLVLGFGIGFGIALYTVVVQNAIPEKIGQASAALTFARQIGATMSLAAMGSIMDAAYVPSFHNALSSTIKALVPAKYLSVFDDPNIILSPDSQKQIQSKIFALGPNGHKVYNDLLDAGTVGLSQGIHQAFILNLGLMGLGLIVVFFLKEIPLLSRKKGAQEGNGPMMMH